MIYLTMLASLGFLAYIVSCSPKEKEYVDPRIDALIERIGIELNEELEASKSKRN